MGIVLILKKTVFRGTGYNALKGMGLSKAELLQNPKLLVGKTYTDKGFMSTATDYQTAKEYSQGKVLWKIKLPKGAKAVKQSELSQDGGPEITIQRNAELKITRALMSNGVLLINAKYVKIKNRK